jgi:protein SCO1/2
VSGRLRLALLVAVLSACAAVGLVVATQRRLTAAGPLGASIPGLAGALRPPGLPVVDFRLRDQDGRQVAAAGSRGRVTMVTFLYTTCRDTCPITARQIAAAMSELGHPVPALAVSVDPAHDTPELARRFVARAGLTGRMRFLLGSASELQPVWRAFGVAPERRGAEHTAALVLLDRRGRQRIGFGIDGLTAAGIAHDVRALELAG